MNKQPLLKISFSLALGLALLGAGLGLLPRAVVAAPAALAGTRATLTLTLVSRSGTDETGGMYTADGDGHKFNNNGATWVRVVNDYTATITATFVTPGEVDGLEIADQVVAVANGDTTLIGPFPPGRFNQSDGTTHLDWDSAVTGTVATSVTVGAFRLQ